MVLNNVGSFYLLSIIFGNNYPKLNTIGNRRSYSTKNLIFKDFEMFFNKDISVNTTIDNSDVLTNKENLNNVNYKDIAIFKEYRKETKKRPLLCYATVSSLDP